MESPSAILSRHRLPQPYRSALVLLWCAPPMIFFTAMMLCHGVSAVTDPRFILPLIVMMLPATYIWREGVDVRHDGLVIRIHVPRFAPFSEIGDWHYDRRPEVRVITLWNRRRQIILEARAAHLTHVDKLLSALNAIKIDAIKNE